MRTGDRGALEVHSAERGVIQGYFVPEETPGPGTEVAKRLAAGVKLLEADPTARQMKIFPPDTRPWSDGFLAPKYAQVTTIILPVEIDPKWDLEDALEGLPSGFTRDYEYGLGLAREYEVIIDLIEKSTACSVIKF